MQILRYFQLSWSQGKLSAFELSHQHAVTYTINALEDGLISDLTLLFSEESMYHQLI